MININDLKIERAKTPLAVCEKNPVVQWSICGEEQKAYRIKVFSSKEKLELNDCDVFDSKKIQDSQTIGHTINGENLISATRYFVTVEVFGESSSDKAQTYFQTAPNPSDWKGYWTYMPLKRQGGSSVYRKNVMLDSAPEIATAYVAGLGWHELFINGKKAGDGVFAPSNCDYSKKTYYSVYDVTKYLTAGENVIGVELAHGWFGSKKLLLQLNIVLKNGEKCEFHSTAGAGWWTKNGAVTEDSVYDGEVYDARIDYAKDNLWAQKNSKAGIDEGYVLPIIACGESTLFPDNLPAEKVCGEYDPVSVNRFKDVLIYDFGVNISGWVKIKVKAERGARIYIKYTERLKSNGDVDATNLRSALAADVYIASGETDGEIYSPRFTYHGFQYAKIQTEGTAEIISVVAQHVHTDSEVVGSFSCSDEKLNYLHKIAVRTELNNQHATLTDCPQRDERFGWINDLASRLYQTVYNCEMSAFFSKIVADISDTMTENGCIGDTAPYYVGGRPADPVGAAYLLMPFFSYKFYGDKTVILREYNNLKRWVDFLYSEFKNGSLNYSYYGDWVYPECYGKPADKYFVSSISALWQMELMTKIAKIAGEKKDEEKYSSMAKAVKNGLNERFYDKKNKTYSLGTQTENSMALSLKLVPEEDEAAVAEKVYADVVNKNYHSSCGNVGYRHMFYALANHGYADAVIKILKNPEYPGWGYMVANGATSVWERWESKMSSEMNSFDHPMFGSYDAFFYAFLGGISVDDDAFACDKITIAPVTPEGMTFAKCSFKTVRGKIVSEWIKTEDNTSYHIEIPFGVTARVKICGEEKKLTHGVYDFTK